MSQYITGIRRLFGRSTLGNRNRKVLKITMTPGTVDWIKDTVDFGPGMDGSATIELGTRLLLALVTEGEMVDELSEDLSKVVNSPYFMNNLRRLTRLMETKQ